MDELASHVIRKHGDMKSSRANWDSHWLEVTEHVIPRKKNVFDFRTQPGGEKRQVRVFDSTAIQANELLASALQGMLTNPSSTWFELSTGIPEIDSISSVRGWLQKASRKMVAVMNNSNFQTQIHEVYIDLGSIGTGVLRMEEDDDLGVRFQSRPVYEFQIRENAKGIVDIVSRETKKDSRQIKQRYNLKKAAKNLSEMDRFKLNKFEEDPLKEWNMLHYVAPMEDVPKELIPARARRFKFVSIHVVEELDLVLEVGGFEEFPYAVPRWTKTSSEVYGRSPAIKSLPDIKMINEVMKTQIRAAQKSVDPALQVPDDGMLLPIRTTPGGINYYRAGTPDRVVPLDTGSRMDLGQAFMDDVRKRIRDAFFIDQLQLNEGPQMTATEVLQRTEEKLRLLGPVLGRLHFELLKPLVNRTFNILARRKELPPNPPPELEGRELEVQFSSMISRAQKSSEADNITRVINIAAPVAQSAPEMLDNINPDGFLKFLGNVFNVPQEIFRSEDEVEEVRAQRQQAQQEAQEAQLNSLNSQSAKNIGVQAQ